MASASTPLRADWSQSTVAERLEFLFHHQFDGDMTAMTQTTTLSRKLLTAAIKGKAAPTVEELRKITTRSQQVSAGWLLQGRGRPYDKRPASYATGEPMKKTAEPAETPTEHAVLLRVRRLVDLVCGGDVGRLASLLGTSRSQAEVLLRGPAAPPDDLLLRLAEYDPRINLDWLLGGRGEPLLEAPPAPAVDSALDGLVKLVETHAATQKELAKFREELTAAVGVATQCRLAMQELQTAQADDRKQIADVVARIDELHGRVDATSRAALGTGRELSQKIDDLVARADAQFKERRELAKRLTTMEGTLVSDEVLANRCTALEGRLDALTERLDLEAAAAGDGDSHKADAVEELYSVLRRLTSEDGPIAKLTRRLDAVEAAAAARRPAYEPGDLCTVADWASTPGPHQYLLNDSGDRKLAGKRLAEVYRLSGLPLDAQGGAYLFAAEHLDWYTRWLESAGLFPATASWLEYWNRAFQPSRVDQSA